MTKNEFIQRMVISLASGKGDSTHCVYSDNVINNVKSLAYKMEKNGVLFDPDPKEVIRDYPKYNEHHENKEENENND